MSEMIFETELAGGVALYDASHLMPLPSGMWPRRPFGAFVNRVFVHHFFLHPRRFDARRRRSLERARRDESGRR